jgi:hypothetical protein
MKNGITDSTIARIAGNIAAGMVGNMAEQVERTGGWNQAVAATADEAVDLAEAIAGEVERRADRSPGIRAIEAERIRQVERKGYSQAHDDTHNRSEMAFAAGVYLQRALYRLRGVTPWTLNEPQPWPIGMSTKDPADDLAKAGALIAAELDRLARAKAATS